MILRNPMDCTFSMYSMMRRDRREPCRTFAKRSSKAPRIAAGWEWAWDYQQGFMLADRVAADLRPFPNSRCSFAVMKSCKTIRNNFIGR